MTQVVVKKEKPCILTEEFFKSGMFVVDFDNDVYITAFDQDEKTMILVSLKFGERIVFCENHHQDLTILEKGTVLELTV